MERAAERAADVGMIHPVCQNADTVIGPDGSLLLISDLPAPGTKRWVARRKAEVVAAVRGGLLSLDEARTRYRLTLEELASWQQSWDRNGLAGLRSTRPQDHPAKRSGSSANASRDRGMSQRPVLWSQAAALRRLSRCVGIPREPIAQEKRGG
jgi:Protein of unknown function (DUF1153)